ncbi:MAG TPA: RHS repeat-associated core domain-containing protein, partial [Candidatus Kapabacteria bacterium]|nr:RHS repeat-associated core domain-containing protein [Candidatus Kapabacteria bacterium]
EYNVYSGEGVFSSYRLAYAHTQKNYYIYNHLDSKAVEVDSAGNIIDYVQYSPFGEPLEKNNYQPQWNERLGYIDKEKDRESKLGDHGVRKYDYEIGRFTSIDPLWEKYTGWTGYQYSLNNTVNASDGNGLLVENHDGSLKSKSQDKKNPNSSSRYLITEKNKLLIPAVNGSASNCAGYALTGEFHWDITTFDGMDVINDEYNEVENQNNAQKDDIIVYFDKNKDPVHFGRIIGIKKDNKSNIVDMIYQWVDGSTSWETVPKKTSVNDLFISRGYGNKKLYSRTIYRKKDGLNKPRKLEEKSNIID